MTINFVINSVSPPLAIEQAQALEHIPASLLSDNLRRLEGVLGLQRLNPFRRRVGTAVTVKIRSGDNLLTYKVISVMEPGHVLVGDEDGIVSFLASELKSLPAAAEQSRHKEQAIREEILTGAVRQFWM